MPELPLEFLNSLGNVGGLDIEALAAVHREEEKITSIRLNPFKPHQADFPTGAKVPWSNNGYYLSERPYFTHDPLFHAGCYYVQEPGSMFLEFAMQQVLDLRNDLFVLDMCAAPGGKSTLINGILSEGSVLIANEMVANRSLVLADNLSRWGTGNTIVTNNDPGQLTCLEGQLHALIVDAPCSGSGLFRKQPDAINEWSPAAPASCAIRQRKILASAVPLLSEGGYLFYSTCSYSKEENEDIVNWMVTDFGLEYVPLKVDKAWGIAETEAGYRFYPHLMRSEGFFMAVLKKPGGASDAGFPRVKLTILSGQEKEFAEHFFDFRSGFVVTKFNGRVHFCSENAAYLALQLPAPVFLKKCGVYAGEIKGRDFLPSQESAWSINLKNDLPHLNLERDEAVRYLKKESLPGRDTTGLHLVCYKDFGLGWAKIMTNRINNYLPAALRILR